MRKSQIRIKITNLDLRNKTVELKDIENLKLKSRDFKNFSHEFGSSKHI